MADTHGQMMDHHIPMKLAEPPTPWTVTLLVFLVAILHIGFLILEMFLWQTPRVLALFREPPDHNSTAAMAANQGLYNGFLAAGMLLSFAFSDTTTAFAFRVFFLSCALIAGLYGGWSVTWRISLVQAFPAALALVALTRYRRRLLRILFVTSFKEGA